MASKQDNHGHAGQDLNKMLKITLNKIVSGSIEAQKQKHVLQMDNEGIFETKEVLILNKAGIPVYRKSKIFKSLLTAINKAIDENIDIHSAKPFVIQTEELTTIITPGNGFNVVIIGSGKQLNKIKSQAIQICQVIAESRVMDLFTNNRVNMTISEDAFHSLRNMMPRNFTEFFDSS
ncbi:MAG: hypothetical protein ACXAEU_19265 [Candidatus Hodarchaeales archaeon]|jgi:hypothetical protein